MAWMPALRLCCTSKMAARLLLRRLCASGRRYLSSGGTDSPRSRLYEHVRQGYSERPRLDIQSMRQEAENLKIHDGDMRRGGRGLLAVINTWEQLEKVRLDIQRLETEKTDIANEVKQLVTSHDKQSLQTLPRYTSIRQRGKEIRLQLTSLYQEESRLDESFYCQALKLPNRTHPDTPVGDESNARVLEVVGEKPEFDFALRGHLEIGEALDIIRQRRLSHVSGHRSYYLRGAGTLLQYALVNFTLSKLVKKGFIPMSVPDVLKGAVFVSIVL
ncbi:serine--tRNA ligase, mitochondrial-like [Bombina bombina]|uniref:serine--tRNA ligase, mitochondrial-like n=1 Tax=Bombina bombina TaxID=8345 RepID=UPI00235AEEA0|nr:serine--tRNA ligase, mitochondrial-like [Bombina bombina]